MDEPHIQHVSLCLIFFQVETAGAIAAKTVPKKISPVKQQTQNRLSRHLGSSLSLNDIWDYSLLRI